MIGPRFVVSLAFLLVTGCSHRVPVATVEVIDVSLSITPRAEHAALDAVGYQISHLGRGDRLVVIPITGDAQNDAGGRILRLSVPTTREPYDTDLRRFQENAQKQFTAWTASFERRQSRTDILGALDAARQELILLPKDTERRLIVVSDFIEDDGIYRFVSDTSLTSSAHARQLAAHLREQHAFALRGVPLCLGRLESSDFPLMSPRRKVALREFWMSYFDATEESVEIQLDGAGILADAGRSCVGGKH